MTSWLIHRADDLNHWTCPGKRCWSKTLCLYDAELLVWEEGLIRGKPSWGSSRRLRRTIDEQVARWTGS